MKHAYKISPAIAWQSYDCIDMLFILNRKNRNFYFFRDSGRLIIENILRKHSIPEMFNRCKEVYDVSDDVLSSSINHFIELLLREELIYDPDSET